MEIVHSRCAGIDVSKRDAKVCVRVAGMGRRKTVERVRTWGSTTNAILAPSGKGAGGVGCGAAAGCAGAAGFCVCGAGGGVCADETAAATKNISAVPKATTLIPVIPFV